jgi:outer membrane protein OmpA-like peptidoglycan-associated protein
MKKVLIIVLMAVSTMVGAQEKDYKITQISTESGSTWGAIQDANGQIIFVNNDAHAKKTDVFESHLFLSINKKETTFPSFENYDRIGSPYISADGKEFYFTVSGTQGSRVGGNIFKSGTFVYPLQIMISNRGADGKWTEPVAFAHNSNTYSCGDPCLSLDGSYLYFTSDKAGGQGGTDIYRSKRNGNTWGEPENLNDKINTSGEERFPRFDSQGNLYFSTTKGSQNGDLDFFVSTRSGNTFTTPVRMSYPFNSDGDDFAVSFINDDSGYISSNRSRADRIYYFEPVKAKIVIDTIRIIDVPKEVRPDLILAELLKNGTLKYIHFTFDKSDIRKSEVSNITELLVFMRQYPTVVLELSGYADCRGADKYNLNLSKKRATAAKDYLVSTGRIDANRIVVKEYGTANPVNDCNCGSNKNPCSDIQYEANRRVEYKVLSY